MQDLSQEIIDLKPEYSIRRRKLLPIWIKLFIWLFLIFGAIAFITLLFGAFIDNMKFSIYGLTSFQPYSTLGLIILFIFLLKGIVSFGLWFEKDWGPKLAVYDGILGALVCLFVMFILPYLEKAGQFSFRLELIAIVPYMMKMINIQEPWVQTSEM